MSDHIKQQVLQEFFAKKSHSPKNNKTGFFCFTRVGELEHISKISYLFGVEAVFQSVAQCAVQNNQKNQTGDRGLNPVFNFFFSIGSTCSCFFICYYSLFYVVYFDLILL